MREEHGQWVFENRVLRKILGRERHEVAGEWGTLHSELYDLYSSPNISGDRIENNEIGGACGTYGGQEVYIGFWWGDLKEEDHLE
jgi:hypothetical protein